MWYLPRVDRGRPRAILRLRKPTFARPAPGAGFTSVEVTDAPGPQNSIYVCRR